MTRTLKLVWIAAALALATGCGGANPSSATTPANSLSSTVISSNLADSEGAATAVADAQAAVAPRSLAVGGSPAPSPTPRVLFHEYRENCDTDVDFPSGAPQGSVQLIDAPQDPIVHPGVLAPPGQHIHTFFGNKSINPNSTADSLMAAPSTCNAAGGHQAWWVPALSLDGQLIHPKNIVVYYKMGPDGFNATVSPLAQGIRILSGSTTQTEAAFSQIGSWTCGGVPRTPSFPDSCTAGSDLTLRLDGPNCVADLTATDSPTHRTHIVYPVKVNGVLVCPADHPIAVAMPVLKISYTVPTGVTGLQARLKVSQMQPDGTVAFVGPAWSMHADEIFAFDTATFAHLVAYCINGGRQCDNTGNGPHITLP